MGTGGLVVFRSQIGGKTEVYLKVKFHADGDYFSLGFKLARFLSGVVFTNGLSGLDSLEGPLLNPDLAGFFPPERVEEVKRHQLEKLKNHKTVCNGFDCLVAQFVSQFKHGPGGLYILPLSAPLECEFVYVVDYDYGSESSAFNLTTWQGKGEEMKNLTLAAFRSLCNYVLPEDPQPEAKPLKKQRVESPSRGDGQSGSCSFESVDGTGG
ncbi:unnamed protein product [Symbiodinium natans]|uniref:Uncharacterized protein n=1 Tax=Symbiodinium natans TaxID=878477 RepID=A0A812J1T1_9DINO|nr:unnamed protein product [Symbiodinium natans]